MPLCETASAVAADDRGRDVADPGEPGRAARSRSTPLPAAPRVGAAPRESPRAFRRAPRLLGWRRATAARAARRGDAVTEPSRPRPAHRPRARSCTMHRRTHLSPASARERRRLPRCARGAGLGPHCAPDAVPWPLRVDVERLPCRLIAPSPVPGVPAVEYPSRSSCASVGDPRPLIERRGPRRRAVAALQRMSRINSPPPACFTRLVQSPSRPAPRDRHPSRRSPARQRGAARRACAISLDSVTDRRLCTSFPARDRDARALAGRGLMSNWCEPLARAEAPGPSPCPGGEPSRSASARSAMPRPRPPKTSGPPPPPPAPTAPPSPPPRRRRRSPCCAPARSRPSRSWSGRPG